MSAIDRYRGNQGSSFRDLWDPRMDRFLENTFGRFPFNVDQGWETSFGEGELQEMDDSFILTFDVPGMRAEDIHIEACGNRLRIHGERREHGREGRRGRRSFFGRVEESLILPADIDSSQVEAELHDGVLRVAIPKSESMKPHHIAIGAKKEGGLLSKLRQRIEGVVTGEKNKETAASATEGSEIKVKKGEKAA